jgi:hypothetical protein
MDAKLKPAPGISWIVEVRGVTLVSRQRGAFASIPYPYAGLWAMVADGTYTPERARKLMALLMAVDEEESEREIVRTSAAWRGHGLVVTE